MNFGVKFDLGLKKINFGIVKNNIHIKIAEAELFLGTEIVAKYSIFKLGTYVRTFLIRTLIGSDSFVLICT